MVPRLGGEPPPMMMMMMVANLNVVDGNLLGAGSDALVLAVTVLVELEAAVAILVGAESVGLVDLGVVGQLAVGLPRGGLVMRWKILGKE